MKFFIFMVFVTIHLEAATKDGRCRSSVSSFSTKVTEDNAVPGARVRVGEIKPKSIFGMPNPLLDGLRIRGEDGVNSNAIAKPSDELEIVVGPKRLGGVNTIVVKHLTSGVVGHVFWNDFRLSTALISAGEPIAAKKPKKTNTMKFPLSQDFNAEDKGLTRYGRPYARPGEFVWIGNLPRIMSPKNIGRIAASEKKVGAGTFPNIELINGKTISEDAHWIIPLTEKEVAEAKKTFRDEVKVDWFQ